MVPTGVPDDNQAGRGKVSVELKPIELRPVHDKPPTARRGRPFHWQGILHEDIHKMDKKPNSPEGDEAVEIDESTSYEDWLHYQGLEGQDFELKVKVEDITDDKDKGSSKMTEQKTEEISDENKSENKSDGKIDDSTKTKETDIKEDNVPDVKQLDTLKFKVQDLIDKGKTKEQSKNKIKRLKMILSC